MKAGHERRRRWKWLASSWHIMSRGTALLVVAAVVRAAAAKGGSVVRRGGEGVDGTTHRRPPNALKAAPLRC